MIITSYIYGIGFFILSLAPVIFTIVFKKHSIFIERCLGNLKRLSLGGYMVGILRVFLVSLIGVGVLISSGEAAYRNVALNKNDVHMDVWNASKGYPHASSNSEYPFPGGTAQDVFYALNAINGDTLNSSHGSMQYASWGPNLNVPGLYWRVEFGKQLEIDKLVIWLRADWTSTSPAPHDSYWKSATLAFSDSSKQNIKIDSTAKGQTITITKVKTSSVTFTNLVASNPAKWCAFTEVQIWGDDPVTVVQGNQNHAMTKTFPSSFSQTLIPLEKVKAKGYNSMEFFSINGTKLGQWKRGNEPANAEISVPRSAGTGIVLVRGFR